MIRTLCAVLAITASVEAQSTTWIVGSGGFPDLQTAFDDPQVMPGDIVVVHSGSYASAVLRKGLVIRANPGAVLPNGAVLTIDSIPGQQRAIVTGLHLDGGSIHAQQCDGLVHLENLTGGGISSPANYYVALSIVQCAWFSAVNVALMSVAIDARDSNLIVERCSWLAPTPVTYVGNVPTLSLLGCSVSIADSRIEGGVYFSPQFPHVPYGSCPAIHATNSFIGAVGGVIAGGDVPGFTFGPLYAVVSNGGGALVLDPSVALARSGRIGSVSGITPIRRAIPKVQSTGFVRGAMVGIGGFAPGEPFAILLGSARPPVFVPQLDGGLGLDLSAPWLVLTTGFGSTMVYLPVPNLPHLQGQILGVQTVAGSTTLRVSNPSVRPIF